MADSLGLFCRHEIRYLKKGIESSEIKRMETGDYAIDIGGELSDISVKTVGGKNFLKSPVKSVITSGMPKYFWYQTL